MKSWFLRIVNNAFIDYLRFSKNIPTHNAINISPTDKSAEDGWTTAVSDTSEISMDFPDENADKTDEIMQNERTNKVLAAISKLPKAQREIIFYRHVRQLSFKEIAEITGVSINTCLGRMRYALINIRKTLGLDRILIKE